MHVRLVSHLFADPRYQALIRQRRAAQRKWAGAMLFLGIVVLACLAFGVLPYGNVLVAGTVFWSLLLLRGYARQCRALFDPEEAAIVREARDAKE